jgi:AcrR family transcriptional regulator
MVPLLFDVRYHPRGSQAAIMKRNLPRDKKTGRPLSTEIGERTDLLLSMAETALIELGYEGATLNVIARRARVSKKTIYAKFDGKQGLLRAVLARMADRNMSLGFERLWHDDPMEGLYHWARMILRINQTEAARAITAISMREGRRFPEFIDTMVESRRMHQQAPLADYLQDLRAKRRIADVDCDAVAAMMLWMLAEDMVLSVASGTDPASDDDALDEKARRITLLITKGITGGALGSI